MNIDQITNELKNLSDKINLIDNNVKFNIQMYWAVLAVMVAVIGTAIYFLIKQFVNYTFNKEISKIDDRIEIVVRKILREEFKEFKEKEVNCKIDKNSLINNTSANIKGFPLDATVANYLAKEINKIKKDIKILKDNEKTTL